MWVRGVDGDGSAAYVCGNDVHGHPFHRGAFGDGVKRVIAKDRRGSEDFTRGDQIEKGWRDNRVQGDLLAFEFFYQLQSTGFDDRADDLVTRRSEEHTSQLPSRSGI